MSNRDTSASSRTANLKAKTLAVYHRQNPDMPDSGRVKGQSATVLLNRKVGREMLPLECCLPPIVCPPLGDFTQAYYNTWDVGTINEFQNDLRTFLNEPDLTIPPPPVGYNASIPAFFIYLQHVENATQYIASISDPKFTVGGTQAFIGPYTQPYFIVPTPIFIFFYPERSYSSDLIMSLTASDPCGNTRLTNATFLI